MPCSFFPSHWTAAPAPKSKERTRCRLRSAIIKRPGPCEDGRLNQVTELVESCGVKGLGPTLTPAGNVGMGVGVEVAREIGVGVWVSGRDTVLVGVGV